MIYGTKTKRNQLNWSSPLNIKELEIKVLSNQPKCQRKILKIYKISKEVVLKINKPRKMNK